MSVIQSCPELTRVLRNYLRRVEECSIGILSDEKNAWLVWAKQKVDWFDPLLNKEDALTENDKKNILRDINMRDNSGEDKEK